MSEQPTATFEGLLRRFPAFRELEMIDSSGSLPAHVPFIARLVKLLLGSLPEFFFCIVEGRGRLLHDDPGLRRPVTLLMQ